jgi:hypothetical protein
MKASGCWGSSAAVQVGANVVEPVEGSSVDIRRVQLGPGRQRFGQPRRSLTELPEPAGHVAQAQAGQSKQLTPSDCPCSHLDAAVLDERAIVVAQRNADQRHGRLGLVRRIAEPAFHRHHNGVVGQRSRVFECSAGVRHTERLRRTSSTVPEANGANIA